MLECHRLDRVPSDSRAVLDPVLFSQYRRRWVTVPISFRIAVSALRQPA